MHQATFTLRQETPLVHFLHDQPGATLRATELKPKLDKMIVAALGEEAVKDWISRKGETGHIALDYKVRIVPMGEPKSVELNPKPENGLLTTEPYPHLLANMGGKENKQDLKNLVMYDGAILEIKTWHDGLLAKIKEHLPKLMAQTNFGNRSGKGFGSFICIQIDGANVDFKVHLNSGIRFVCDTSTMDVIGYPPDKKPRPGQNTKPETEREIQKSLFNVLDIFYKTLRSGINYGHKDFYFKSLMYRYADEVLKEQWDKKTIKEQYFTGNGTNHNIDHRNFLGLSTIEQWGIRSQREGKKWIKPPGAITREGVRLEEGGGDALYKKEEFRFPSPLMFKPVRLNKYSFEIYLTYDDQNISDYKRKAIRVQKDGDGELVMRPSQRFHLKDFIEFVRKVDLDTHVSGLASNGGRFEENPIYTSLIKKIYDQIHIPHHV